MAPVDGAGGVALGTVALLRTPPPSGRESVLLEQVVIALVARQQRYSRQRTVRSIMASLRRLDRKGDKAPYRVTHCLWTPRQGMSGASIVKTTKGAVYSGLQVCGSVWHCPVCAARITNERRKEITAAIDAAEKLGYKPVLVTLTSRHHAKTNLRRQLGAMTKAHEALWRGAPAQRFKERSGMLGYIRNLEVTHSIESGWHSHMHLVVFVPKETPLDIFETDMRARWKRVAARHGLDMNAHGFDATDVDKRIADYLVKLGDDLTPEGIVKIKQSLLKRQKEGWNEADELARWHTKKGKGHQNVQRAFDQHVTPWQLVDYAAAGDEAAARLFQQYALAFHGRRQLHWSDGLRAILGLEQEKTDEEAAQEQQEGDKLLEVYLNKEQWGDIRGNDYRAELLALVERSTPAEIRVLCLELFGWEPQIIEPKSTVSSGNIDTGGTMFVYCCNEVLPNDRRCTDTGQTSRDSRL
jgi:hypothetical protein